MKGAAIGIVGGGGGGVGGSAVPFGDGENHSGQIRGIGIRVSTAPSSGAPR